MTWCEINSCGGSWGTSFVSWLRQINVSLAPLLSNFEQALAVRTLRSMNHSNRPSIVSFAPELIENILGHFVSELDGSQMGPGPESRKLKKLKAVSLVARASRFSAQCAAGCRLSSSSRARGPSASSRASSQTTCESSSRTSLSSFQLRGVIVQRAQRTAKTSTGRKTRLLREKPSPLTTSRSTTSSRSSGSSPASPPSTSVTHICPLPPRR